MLHAGISHTTAPTAGRGTGHPERLPACNQTLFYSPTRFQALGSGFIRWSCQAGVGGALAFCTWINHGDVWSRRSRRHGFCLESGSSRNRVLCAQAVSVTTVFAVGEQDTILQTTDGGTSWTALLSGTLEMDFKSLYFVDDATGWAVGVQEPTEDVTVIVHTSNGGRVG